MMTKKVSIIIPVRIITNYLKEAITHLKNLDYDNFEVLIFTDEKETYKGLPRNFKIIASGKVGPAAKRNLALNYATGDILAFLDDDAYPTSNWLRVAVSSFSDSKICALGGPSMTPPNEKFLEKVSGEVLSSFLTSAGTTHRHIPIKEMYVDDYPSVNLFVRFSDFKKIDGFNSEFWPGEDTKLCLDLMSKTGKKILYNPELIVYHHRRAMLKPHLKQVSRYGMHRGQFARIFPENSRKLQYFIPSLFVLGLFVGPLLSFVHSLFLYVYLFVVSVYLLLLTYETFRVLVKNKSFSIALYFLIGVFLTHIVYGSCFLYGLLERPKLNLKAIDKKTGKYSEG